MALRINTLLDRKRTGKEMTAEVLAFFECLMERRLSSEQVSGSCALTNLHSGLTCDTSEKMLIVQDGELSIPYVDKCDSPVEVKAPRAGTVLACDAPKIWYADFLPRGGRTKSETKIHHGVGIRLRHRKNDIIRAGDVCGYQ